MSLRENSQKYVMSMELLLSRNMGEGFHLGAPRYLAQLPGISQKRDDILI